jgi:S1-C subfamily serine protease
VRAGTGIFCGMVSLIAVPDQAGRRGILTDITAPPGFSGGALVDCESGQLVGIVTFGLVDLAGSSGAAGLIGAVPVAALLELLSDTAARR